jgi:hypothetical protein
MQFKLDRTLALAAGLLAVAIAAPAPSMAAPDVGVAFGNTVVSTYPDGRTALLWLKADGSYTAIGRRKKPSSGRWSLKGAKICLKQVKPVPGPFSYCTDAPNGAIGTRWKAKAVTGEPITVTLVRGVQRR